MGSESSLSLRTLGSQLTDEYGVGSVTSAQGLACPAMLGGRQWPDARRRSPGPNCSGAQGLGRPSLPPSREGYIMSGPLPNSEGK